MNHLNIDIETYSSIDLKKSGLYKYVQSPDFQILLFAYSNIQEAYVLSDKYPLPETVITRSPFPEALLIFSGSMFDHINYEYDLTYGQMVPVDAVFKHLTIINSVIAELNGTRVLTSFIENEELKPMGDVLLPDDPDGQKPYSEASVQWSIDPKYEREMLLYIDAVIFALNLMHCKNIKYVPYDPNKHLTRQIRRDRERKGKLPYLKYEVLEIQPMRERTAAQGRPKDESKNDQRLHTVRGHFKTYTQENPLFGKHIGTYWWGNCVKGNAEIGLIEKDYYIQIGAEIIQQIERESRCETPCSITTGKLLFQ